MRNLKKLFAVIMTAMIFLVCGTTYVNATDGSSKYRVTSTVYSSTPISFPHTFYVRKTNTGKYIYCTNFIKKTPNSGVTYYKGDLITNNGINYILNEAYNNVDSNKDYFIYQTALWIYLQDKGIDTSSKIRTFRSTVNNSNSSTAKKIRSIVSNAKKAGKNDTSAPTIKISGSNVTFNLDSNKKYYVSSKIKVTSSTSKYDVTFKNAPSGTTYKIKDGYLYVYVLASNVKSLSNNFTINVTNSKTTYKSYYYNPSNSNYQKLAIPFKEVKTASASLSLKLNKTVSIKVTKIDSETGKQISGAKFNVKNSQGKVIDSWTSNGSVHTVNGLGAGTYTLTETDAPNGYIKASNSVNFTVDKYGNIKDSKGNNLVKIEMKNTKNTVNLSKQDITNNKELKGAKLVLKNSQGKVIDSWTSNGSVHTVRGIPAGTYNLLEEYAPDGYVISKEAVTFKIDKNGKITDKNGKTIDKVIMYNTPEMKVEVPISKQDITSKEELKGATLELVDSKGNKIDTWVSDGTVHKVKLKIGTYTLTEKIAPNGYVLSTESVTFKIDKDGKITDKNGKSIDKVIMYNKQEIHNTIEISKQDITSKKELKGASLTVIDSNNTIIDTWVSDGSTHKIKDIKAGTYTLKETKAPEGYVLSKDVVKFTVDKDGKITDKNGKSIDKVVIYNEKETQIEEKEVIISKQDIATSKELPGASLVLKDENGKEIDSWISGTEVHKVKLEAGTYTLTETVAPDGYVLSNETIKFTIDKDGKVTDKDGNVIDKVIMFNKQELKVTVDISKQDITTSKELPGASLVLKDENGKEIDSWISGTEVHKVKLGVGTYTLTETVAPDGYVLSNETIKFTIDEKGNLINSNGENIDKVIMNNAPVVKEFNVPIIKQDGKSQQNLAGATLELKDNQGNVLDSWVSTNEAHIVKLESGTYTLSEVKAPNGYILNTNPITFTVDEEGKFTESKTKGSDVIVMINMPKEIVTKVIISKQDITNGKELPGAKLVIKDKEGNVIDSWTSTNTSHQITGLTPGEYTLNEVVAPNGYVLSNETIKFTVKDDGTVTSVVMYNRPVDVPEVIDTPNNGQEIEVENTASFRNIASSVIGAIIMALGTFTIYKKKREF